MTQDKITIKGKEIDLIKELGLEGLPIEKQKEMLERMANVVNKRIILRAMDELSEDEVMEINSSLVSLDTQEALSLLDEKIPNFDKIVSEEIAKFQEEMLK